MKLKNYIGLYIILIFSLNCTQKTQRQVLETNNYAGSKYKIFSATVMHNDFISAKAKIYKEVLKYSIKKLLGRNIYNKNLNKIKTVFITPNGEKTKKYFVRTNDMVRSREKVGTYIFLNMSTTLIIDNLVDDLIKSGFTDIKINDLISAVNIIGINNKDRIKKLVSKKNYLRFYQGKSVGFIHNQRGHVLAPEIINKIYNYVRKSLNNIDINMPAYNNFIITINRNTNYKQIISKYSLDYIIFFSENTSVKRLYSGQYKVDSIINLVLYNKKFMKINSVNLIVDEVKSGSRSVPSIIAKEIIEKGLTNLFLKSSFRLSRGETFTLVLKNFPSTQSIKSLLSKIKGVGKKKISRRLNKQTYVSVKFKGSRLDLQSYILNLIDKNNLGNKIYLTNSEKKVIELTFIGVKIN